MGLGELSAGRQESLREAACPCPHRTSANRKIMRRRQSRFGPNAETQRALGTALSGRGRQGRPRADRQSRSKACPPTESAVAVVSTASQFPATALHPPKNAVPVQPTSMIIAVPQDRSPSSYFVSSKSGITQLLQKVFVCHATFDIEIEV